MSEMIERVAKAIEAAMADPVELYDPKELARAAIEAMRDPTENMCNLFNLQCSVGYGDEPWVSPADAKHNWRAMIDEALK